MKLLLLLKKIEKRRTYHNKTMRQIIHINIHWLESKTNNEKTN